MSAVAQLKGTTSDMNMVSDMPSMALVSLDQVTHSAVASGNWSDPAIWSDAVVPDGWAKVHIPQGVSVAVDGLIDVPAKTLRVDGTLTFAHDTDTELKVDTLVTSASGHLVIGTAGRPISSDVTARIVIADDGAIDKSWDPGLISRGLLLHGKTTINGLEKTAHAALAEFPMSGDTQLTLKSAPVGWSVGDRLVIAGTDANDPTSDETVTITAIDGATIRFDTPLARDHAAPRADLDVHVANLTRNVEISSQSADPGHRGHVMVMHTNDATINYARFDDLGRSDKILGYNDHEFTDLDPAIPATDLGGDNVRGRYSVHFHKGGTDKDGNAAQVKGSVVTDDPGWGFVNHSSHVNFIENVTHNIAGGAYFTEAGDEIGAFIDNIALRTVNPDMPLLNGPEIDPDTREGRQDYGFQGDGFWFHSPNVRVEGNIVSGASGHAYIWWPEGLLERNADGSTSKVFHDTANVPNGDLIGPDGTRMQIMDVPIASFDGNQGYASTKGIQIFYLHTEFFGDGLHNEDGTIDPPAAYDAQMRSTLSNSTIWNVAQSAFAAPYANRLTLDNLRLVGSGEAGTVGLDLSHFMNAIGLEVQDVTIDGFGVGMRVTTEGEVSTQGTTFANNLVDTQDIIPDEDGGVVRGTGEKIIPFGQDVRDDDGSSEDDEPEDEDLEDEEDDELDEDDYQVNRIDGTSGEDTILGSRKDDLILGKASDDTLSGRTGEDTLKGGSGEDVLNGHRGDDVLLGGQDDDVLRGQIGDDCLKGGSGDDLLEGQRGEDTIDGGAGADRLIGGAGDDLISGQRGDDYAFGGQGDDTLRGQSGDDTLKGGSGEDTVNGQRGDDIVDGGAGEDRLIGGAGSDTFIFSRNDMDTVLDFASGEDKMDVSSWGVMEFEVLDLEDLRDGWVLITTDASDSAALLRLLDGDLDTLEPDAFIFASDEL